jgi:hypothetical protein
MGIAAMASSKEPRKNSGATFTNVFTRDQANKALLELMKAQQAMLGSNQPKSTAQGTNSQSSTTTPTKSK